MRSLIAAVRESVCFAFLLRAATMSSCSWAWQACQSDGNDGGICPTGDTCCATFTPGISTCISGKDKNGKSSSAAAGDKLPGSCCLDDDVDDDPPPSLSPYATTGCGPGFQCAKQEDPTVNNNYYSSTRRYCQRIDDTDTDNPPRLPRYRVCSLPKKALQEVYGFPVAPYNVTTTTTSNTMEHEPATVSPPLLFAYYSNLGPIIDAHQESSSTYENDMSSSTSIFAQVKKVVIVIHGSGRNADDYLCCMNAALPPIPGRTFSHADPTNSTILVIAPWFLAPADLPINMTTTATTMSSTTTTAATEPLVWQEHGPIEHTW
jgi:hypothetical protein